MLYHITFITVIVLDYFLGFFVFFKNRKKLTNLLFLLFNFFAATWLLSLYLFYIVKIQGLVLLIGRINFASVIIFTFFMFLFVYYFPVNLFRIKKIYLIILSLETAFLTIITLFTNLIDKDEIVLGNVTIFGTLYPLFVLHYIAYFLFVIIILAYKYRKLIGLERLQIKYLIWGFTISAVIGLITNIFLPLIWGYYGLQQIGILCIIVSVAMMAYSIVRYRLMDIRVIIRRSAVFTVLVLFITIVYSLLAYLLSLVFTNLFGYQSLIVDGVVTAVLVALGFEPLKTWLSLVTDKYLFKAEYNPQEVLSEFSERLTSSLDLKEISSFIVNRLGEIFKSRFVSLFLLDEGEKQYYKIFDYGKVVADMGRIDKKLFDKIFSYLQSINQERAISVREELKKNNETLQNATLKLLTDTLDKFEVNLIVPLYQRDKLIGILFLGDKKSGDVYSMQDLRILDIISGQSAVAMQNAQLFEEQKHFAEHLKKEVDRATKELQVANIQLKKLDEAKSEFISIASHQLRTPLTAIKGYLSMVQQGDYGKIPAKLNAPVDRVMQSTDRIIHLIEDLLNISRIESGRMDFEYAPTDLNALAEDVFSELMVQAKKKNLLFEYIKPVKPIPKLSLDQSKIREVIMNLTDNAIKYTPKGFVKMKLERLDDSVRFSVTDSGRGLEADEIPLLFQKFSRARGVQLVHTEGTGLGLYIAKNIIEKHNGKIWVESKGKDKGSTFIIEFKIKNPKLEHEARKQE